jgi:hypothetical protein
MIQNFTPNDLLKAKTGELTTEENILLDSAVAESIELSEFAEVLDLIEEEMPKLIQDPGEFYVQRIMARIRQEMPAKIS